MTDRTKYRVLEAIPGLLLWGALVSAVIFSFLRPIYVIYFVILFDFFWLLRVSYFIFYIIHAWRLYKRATARDWFRDLDRLHPEWRDYYHVIFLPTYREELAVIQATFDRLTPLAYDPKRFIVVLAGEERDHEHFKENVQALKEKYGGRFHSFIITEHPKDLPDELPGKGSNLHWAGHCVQEQIDAMDLPYDKIIVSTFDVDTIVNEQYFACLTTTYLEQPQPERSSYQPAVLYHNNLWESPAIVRIAAFGTTFWLMTELARPERLLTFSSHSMSWQTLVDVGFWEKQIVSEDSRIFLQCLIRYDGEYRVTPMYVPVSMDMAAGRSYLSSLGALYKQQRRWAWGAENIPYMIWNFSKNKKMPLIKKIYYVWNVTEGMFQWAAAPFLIFILGRLPMLVAGPALQGETLFQNAPLLLETLMELSMAGILVSAILSLFLLPRRPSHIHASMYAVMLLQWIMLPVTLIIFGSIPAIDAQTRLMLGKYLGFNVTQKVRKAL